MIGGIVSPIALDDARVVGRKVQGGHELGRAQDLDRLAVVLIALLHGAARIRLPAIRVDAAQQARAILEAFEANATKHHAVGLLVGAISHEGHGFVRDSGEAGAPAVGPRISDRIQERGVGRHAGCGGAFQLRDERAQRRPPAGRLGVPALPSRHALVGVVLVVRVHDGADDGELVHHPGHAGEMLADPDAGDVRPDGPKFAPNLGGRLGLEVEHVEVRRAAAKEDVDDGLVRAPGSGLRLEGEELCQGESPGRHAPDPQERAARQRAIGPTQDAEHQGTSSALGQFGRQAGPCSTIAVAIPRSSEDQTSLRWVGAAAQFHRKEAC